MSSLYSIDGLFIGRTRLYVIVVEILSSMFLRSKTLLVASSASWCLLRKSKVICTNWKNFKCIALRVLEKFYLHFYSSTSRSSTQDNLLNNLFFIVLQAKTNGSDSITRANQSQSGRTKTCRSKPGFDMSNLLENKVCWWCRSYLQLL